MPGKQNTKSTKTFFDTLENDEIPDSEDDPDYDAADKVEQESTSEKERADCKSRHL